MRGYWLPQGHEALSACDGFFIRSTAIYFGTDTEKDWELFLSHLFTKIRKTFPDFRRINAWVTVGNAARFVLAENEQFQLVSDDVDGYVAVYLIVPETVRCGNRINRLFGENLIKLRAMLLDLFPDSLYHRENYRELKKVTKEHENG